MKTIASRFVLGLLIAAALLAVPSAALADGGPYTDHTFTNSNGTQEEFLIAFGNCPSNFHNVSHRWNSGGGWSNWANMGGCVDAFDVGMNQDGRLELFGIGSDYAVWHIWQTKPASGPWSNWASLGGTLKGNAPWVGSWFNSQPYLHVYGLDTIFGNRWVNYQTQIGCCWSGWHRG